MTNKEINIVKKLYQKQLVELVGKLIKQPDYESIMVTFITMLQYVHDYKLFTGKDLQLEKLGGPLLAYDNYIKSCFKCMSEITEGTPEQHTELFIQAQTHWIQFWTLLAKHIREVE